MLKFFCYHLALGKQVLNKNFNLAETFATPKGLTQPNKIKNDF
jgi:hypothetical protein